MKLPRPAGSSVLLGLLLTGAVGVTAAAQNPQPSQTRPSVRLINDRADAVVEFQRPLRGQERAELVQSGVRIYRSRGGSRYVVRASESTMAVLQSHPLFVSIEPGEIGTKMSSPLLSGKPASHATGPDGTVRVMVHFYPDVDFGQANSTLRRLGLKPVEGKKDFEVGNRLEASGRLSQVQALAE